MKFKTLVKDLRAGDVLLPTNRIVTHGPVVGARTPKGKCELVVNDRVVIWGRNTLITVEREGTAAVVGEPLPNVTQLSGSAEMVAASPSHR
jgi:hypothetical protein